MQLDQRFHGVAQQRQSCCFAGAKLVAVQAWWPDQSNITAICALPCSPAAQGAYQFSWTSWQNLPTAKPGQVLSSSTVRLQVAAGSPINVFMKGFSSL
jgi:hypothetical protein